jgi:hypothetical protein
VDVSKFLNGGDEGEWYRIPGTKKARLRVKILKPKREDEIREECVSTDMVGGKVRSGFDKTKYNELCTREMVTGWEDLENEGESLPFSADTAVLLDQNWPEFRQVTDAVSRGASHATAYLVEVERGN